MVILALYLALGMYFFNFSQNPKISKRKLFKKENTKFPYLDECSKEWFKNIICEDAYINKSKKVKLHAYLINNEKKKWVIILHGYTNSSLEMLTPTKHFYDLGYNVLLIDQRAHGLSDGKYSTMGYFERLDLCDWISYLNNQYKNIKIILYGVSMGATTVMMTTTENLPQNVILGIEDCGFISIYQQFYNQLKYLKFYPKPIIFSSFIISMLYIRFNIYKAEIKKLFPKNKIPMLFIHGSNDKFVSTKLFESAYLKYQYKKEKLIIDDAKHMMSMKTDPKKYWETIEKFIKKYEVKNEK